MGRHIAENDNNMSVESSLMSYFKKQESKHETRRGKLHYGWKYVDCSRTLECAEELPTAIMNLIEAPMETRDMEDIPLLAVQPNQVGMNDYEPGLGIGWHRVNELGDTIT